MLVPRPRVNLVLDHGMLGPRAAWRREVVPTVASLAIGVATADQPPAENLTSGGRGWRWADLPRNTDYPLVYSSVWALVRDAINIWTANQLAAGKTAAQVKPSSTRSTSGITSR